MYIWKQYQGLLQHGTNRSGGSPEELDARASCSCVREPWGVFGWCNRRRSSYLTDPASLPDATAYQKEETAFVVSTAFRGTKDKRWRNLTIAWVVPELPAG